MVLEEVVEHRASWVLGVQAVVKANDRSLLKTALLMVSVPESLRGDLEMRALQRGNVAKVW